MDRLAEIFGKENVLKDEPMSRHTTFRIGGAADFFVKVQTISQLQEAMRYLKKEQIPFYIVGNGSNLLVRDEGVRGVVLQLGERFSGYEFLHETPGSVAQSGTAVDKNQIVMVRAKAGSLADWVKNLRNTVFRDLNLLREFREHSAVRFI